jgi:hypothetical protein
MRSCALPRRAAPFCTPGHQERFVHALSGPVRRKREADAD